MVERNKLFERALNNAHIKLIKFVVDVCSILSTNQGHYLVVDLLLVGPFLIV